jgi:hypothetical protein
MELLISMANKHIGKQFFYITTFFPQESSYLMHKYKYFSFALLSVCSYTEPQFREQEYFTTANTNQYPVAFVDRRDEVATVFKNFKPVTNWYVFFFYMCNIDDFIILEYFLSLFLFHSFLLFTFLSSSLSFSFFL